MTAADQIVQSKKVLAMGPSTYVRLEPFLRPAYANIGLPSAVAVKNGRSERRPQGLFLTAASNGGILIAAGAAMPWETAGGNELCAAALGVEQPWYVKDVRFDAGKRLLTVAIDFKKGSRFPWVRSRSSWIGRGGTKLARIKRIRYGAATEVDQAAICRSCAGAARAVFQFHGRSSAS